MKGQIDPRELLQKLQHVDVEPDPELNNEVEDYAVEWLQKKVDNCVTSSESTDWDEIMRILNSFDDKNYVGVTKKNGFSKIKPQFTQGRDHFRYDSLHRQWSDYLIWLKDHPFDYKAVPIAEKELLKTLNTWPGSDDVVTHYKKVKEYLENRKNGVSLHISMIKLKEMVIPLGSDVDVTVVMVTANSAAPVQLGTFRARGGESVFERDAIMSAKCSAEILAQMVSLEFHLEWGKFFPGKKMLTFKLDHQTLASLAREDFQRRKPVPLLSAKSKTVELTVECAMTPLPPQLPQPADLRAQIGGRK